MSWFLQKDALAKSSEDVDAKAAEKEAARSEVEALRLAAEAEALAGLDAIYAKAKAVHAQDADGYSFSCKRWGDFLTVFLARPTVRWVRIGEDEVVVARYSTSINIRDSRTITLNEGHGPDLNGHLGYSAHMTKGDSLSGGFLIGGSSVDRKAPEGYRWTVVAELPRMDLRGRMFALDSSHDKVGSTFGSMHFPDPSSRELPKTPNYLRPAEDDRIYFSGIGATIFAPHGRGQEAHDAIMHEIARGAE